MAITQEMIDRINQLAKKKKTEGLSEDEAAEQKALYREYIDAFKATEKFNPYTVRVSHPIALEAFVLGPTDIFYKVIEGYYCLEDGTLRLKVKKKYGK